MNNRVKSDKTWWGEQWLTTLGNIDQDDRLQRGKMYAKKGLVIDITVKEGLIDGKVLGSNPLPYRVKLIVPTFSESQKDKIVAQVTKNPLMLSELIKGNLPQGLNFFCECQKIQLFPTLWSSLNAFCNCPDSSVPCKHIAATIYVLADKINQNPFLIFEMRGLNLKYILGDKKENKEAQKNGILTVRRLVEFKEDNIFEESLGIKDIDFTKIPEAREQLFTILADEPSFYQLFYKNFKEILYNVYLNVEKKVKKIKDKKSLNKLEDIQSTFTNAVFVFDENYEFRKLIFFKNGQKEIVYNDIIDLVQTLQSIPFSTIDNYPPLTQGIILAYQYALQLLQKGAFLPQLLKVEDGYIIRWIPATIQSKVNKIHLKVAQFLPEGSLQFNDGASLSFFNITEQLSGIVSLFLGYYVQEYSGIAASSKRDKIVDLFFSGFVQRFNRYYEYEMPENINSWLNHNTFDAKEKTHLPLIKVSNDGAAFQIELYIEDRTQTPKAILSLEEVMNDEIYENIRLDVLEDMTRLIAYFPELKEIVFTQKNALKILPTQFADVLFNILPALRLLGVKILVPKSLKNLIRPQFSMKLISNNPTKIKRKQSLFGIDTLLNFDWQVAIGDEFVDTEEFLKMVKGLAGIVKINNQYVYVNNSEIQTLIRKIKSPPELNGVELLKVALAEEYDGAKILMDKSTQNILKSILEVDEVPLPEHLLATLRPYQLRGYEWLYKNAQIGFGSLIADDMGLGKTVQVIATLLKMKEEGAFSERKVLIVVPTTLLTNWQKEIDRFAPSLTSLLYHGSNRKFYLKGIDIVLTTYGVLRGKDNILEKQEWAVMVIDEAQNIKNPITAQTRAIKRVNAAVKIAMSGTPVENRLSEYWSIFDFINKGYLGGLKRFHQNYAKPIELERDNEKLQEFRKITAPFILRRLKSDKSIIKDLPEKIETNQYCNLSKDQAAIYQNIVNETMSEIENSEGIQRRGAVLKLLTNLKQVCNHPANFLKDNNYNIRLSGKSELLFELLKNIFDTGEKAIIFTQYKLMGDILVNMLKKEYGFNTPFLHGGLSRKKRDKLVDSFQNNDSIKVMVLSLRAAGVGLNLTAASNVIHYDLWWNPAVESQATDRTYRIGQTKNVQVHRLLTKDTFEEKIDMLIQSKKELANLTVNIGEKWIGELSDNDLRELVRLE